MCNEITVRVIPHDEVLALREENAQLKSELKRMRVQLNEAEFKYVSECNVNMMLEDELRTLRKVERKG